MWYYVRLYLRFYTKMHNFHVWEFKSGPLDIVRLTHNKFFEKTCLAKVARSPSCEDLFGLLDVCRIW
jgi:hypothetical protein